MKSDFRLALILLCSSALLAQMPAKMGVPIAASKLDWQRYFTLDPNEGRSFVLDTTVILSGASVPGFHLTADGQIVLNFAAGPQGLGQALTVDSGRTFQPVHQVAAPMAGDGAFIYLPDGRIRLITEQPLPTATRQRHKSRLVSWISQDGLNWSMEPGVRYQPGAEDDSIASVPAAIQLADSVWRVYYVGDWYRSNGIRTAISTDWGWTWKPESRQNILRNHDVDPHPVYLSDGRIRIYHRHMRAPGGIAFTEGDGLVFDTTRTQMILPDGLDGTGLLLDPAVIKFPDGRIGCFVGSLPLFGQPGQPKIIAAWATDAPSGMETTTELVKEFKLYPGYPNPFQSRTRIAYQIASMRSGATFVRLAIYNLRGQLVRIVANRRHSQGEHFVFWDGRDDQNSLVPSGVYFMRLEAGGHVLTRKVTCFH